MTEDPPNANGPRDTAPDDPDEPDELTTVATFTTRAEADLARERLEAEGIEAFVLDELTASIMPYAMAAGIRLQVPTPSVHQARDVLGLPSDTTLPDLPAADDDDDDDAP